MGLHNFPSFLGLVVQSINRRNIIIANSSPGQMIFINIKGSYIHIPFIFQIKVYNKKVAPMHDS